MHVPVPHQGCSDLLHVIPLTDAFQVVASGFDQCNGMEDSVKHQLGVTGSGGGDGCLFVELADGCGDDLRELPVLFR